MTSLSLIVSESSIYSNKNKLLARISYAHKDKLFGLQNYDFVLLTNSRSKYLAASIQYSDELSQQYIQITEDIAINLGLSGASLVYLSPIKDAKEVDKITVYTLQKQKQIHQTIFPKLAETRMPLDILISEGYAKFVTIDVNETTSLLPLLLYKPVCHGYILENNNFLYVVSLPLHHVAMITRNTKIITSQRIDEKVEKAFKNIGGLKAEVDKLKKVIVLPFEYGELFDEIGIQPIRGILLYGPPGTGKTLLAKSIANATNAKFFSINGPEVVSKFYGDSEKNLRTVFEKAKQSAPSIIFIDEIDSLAPKREEVVGEVQKRIVATLLSLMDGLESRGKVIVIGATNLPNKIDRALRRGGRFDLEIPVPPPTYEGRYDILKILTTKMNLDDELVKKIAYEYTTGFVGADLLVLAKEAGLKAIQRYVADVKSNPLSKLQVTEDDFTRAVVTIQPSALREYRIEKAAVSWKDVVGLKDVIQEIQDELVLPLIHSKIYEKRGLKPPKGVLLYGPPGTGKTLLAKAIATELNYNLVSVNGPELMAKYVGDTEYNIRKVFDTAKQSAPSIIFIDEIDSLLASKDANNNYGNSVVGQFLTEMDGMGELKQVIVLATTNRPDLIDSALLRSGRFDKKIEVTYPKQDAQKELIEFYLKKILASASPQKIDSYAYRAANSKLTGADIQNFARCCIKHAIKENSVIDGHLTISSNALDIAFNEIIANKTAVLKSQKDSYSPMRL